MQYSYFVCPMLILVIFLPHGLFKSMAFFSAQIIFTLLETFDILREHQRPVQVIFLIQTKKGTYLT